MDGILKTLFVISKNAHVSKNIRQFIFKKSKSILYPTLQYVLKYSRWPLVSSRRLLSWLAARGLVLKVMCFSVPHVVFWIIARALQIQVISVPASGLAQTRTVVRPTRYLTQLASYSSSHTAALRKKICV